MRVYVAGALNGSRNAPQAMAKYEAVAEMLREIGVEPYVPHCHSAPQLRLDHSPERIYEVDSKALAAADLLLAFLDEPSLGVGAEIALAMSLDVPVLAVWPQGSHVSPFVRGLIGSSTACLGRPYRELRDVARFVEVKLSGGNTT